MSNKPWTDRQLFILIVAYPETTDTRALADVIGVTYSAMRTKAAALRLRRIAPKCMPGTENDKDLRFIQRHYLDIPIKQIAKRLGRSTVFVQGVMKRLGLVIPKDILEKRKEASYIKPGSVPMNKGKKWDEYMSKEGQRKSRKHCFGKGNLPHTTKYDGAITVRKDNKGNMYQWIRVSKGKWKMLHVYIWEKAHGPVPEGHIIVMKDKNRFNLDLSNLECITREENARRNSHWGRWPRELSETILLDGRLKRKINIIEKRLSNEKQDHRPEKSHVRAAGKARGRNTEKGRPRKRGQAGKSHRGHRKSHRRVRKDRAAVR